MCIKPWIKKYICKNTHLASRCFNIVVSHLWQLLYTKLECRYMERILKQCKFSIKQTLETFSCLEFGRTWSWGVTGYYIMCLVQREREGSLVSALFLYSFCLFVHISHCDNSLLIFCGLSGGMYISVCECSLTPGWIYWEWYAIRLYMFGVIYIFPSPLGCLCRYAGFICCFADSTACVCHFPHLCAAVGLWVGLYLDLHATHLTISEMCSMHIVHDMRFQQNACNNTIMQWALDHPFPVWCVRTFLSFLFDSLFNLICLSRIIYKMWSNSVQHCMLQCIAHF